MKKLLLVFLILVSFRSSRAQTILGFWVYPANPTTSDSVYAVMDCSFNSGGCAMEQSGANRTGNFINVYANHCLGPLTVICYATDTIALGLLPAGNYSMTGNLFVGLDTGMTGSCSGFVQVNQAATAFTVSGTSGIAVTESSTPEVVLLQGQRALRLSFAQGKVWRVDVFDETGKRVRSGMLGADDLLSLEGLAAGTYIPFLTRDGVRAAGNRFVLY